MSTATPIETETDVLNDFRARLRKASRLAILCGLLAVIECAMGIRAVHTGHGGLFMLWEGLAAVCMVSTGVFAAICSVNQDRLRVSEFDRALLQGAGAPTHERREKPG